MDTIFAGHFVPQNTKDVQSTRPGSIIRCSVAKFLALILSFIYRIYKNEADTCACISLNFGTGDDPKEVKARLKVWAQAVALTSASRLGS